MISGFGELLLRLSPQVHEDLIVQSNGLEMGFAGAEANILSDLSHWGKGTQLITALPENPLGKKALMFLNQNGVNTQNIYMDNGRMGTYYIEHGTAIRGTQVTYDRKDSSFAKLNLSKLLSPFFALFLNAFSLPSIYVFVITPALLGLPSGVNLLLAFILFLRN